MIYSPSAKVTGGNSLHILFINSNGSVILSSSKIESRRDVSGSKVDDIFSPTRSRDFFTDSLIKEKSKY